MSLLETGDEAAAIGTVDSSSTSIDNHIARWDGATGAVIQDNGVVTLSDTGIMLGVTSFTVDNILIDGNAIASLGTNQPLTIDSTGTGNVTINGVIIDTNQNIVTLGLLGSAAHTISQNAQALVLKATDTDRNVYMTFRTNVNGRRAYFGFGFDSNSRMDMFNDEGDIGIWPSDGDDTGTVSLNGFAQLGQNNIAHKVKLITVTTAATEGNNTTGAHGIAVTSTIVGVSVVVAGSSAFVPPNHSAVSEHQYTWSIDATNVKIHLNATNSGSILSKPASILITYIE